MTRARTGRLLAALAALAVTAAGLVGAANLAAGWVAAAPRSAETTVEPLAARITKLSLRHLQQQPITWRGGAITASTGEVVNVLVSNTYTPEQATPEAWAEFLVARLHGPELSRLELRLAPFAEVQEICRSLEAIGCYGRNTAISIGETLPDGTTAEEVIRHEYGHHIALYRANPPWQAIDWGPKRWASAVNVCARAARSEVFPGDEGLNYERNPGEGWAEVYRLLDERKAGIFNDRWQVVSPIFFPDAAALQAAELDVVSPWTQSRTATRTRRVGRGRTWWMPLPTPLDGTLTLAATLPRGGSHEIALVAPNRRTVLARASWKGVRAKRLTATICGQRSAFVRVVQKGTTGGVTVSVSRP